MSASDPRYRDLHGTIPWSDARFLLYVEQHGTRNRALWTPEQLDRLEALAGVPVPREPEGVWFRARIDDLGRALVAARARVGGEA